MKTSIRASQINRHAVLTALVAALIGGAAPQAAAHEQHHQHAPAAATGAPWEEAAIRLPDVPVVTQDGVPKRFYSELVKGRTVAINFMYTSCSAVCSPMTATLQKVQRDLLARGGAVEFISISVDPATDTPAVLKEYAQRFGAGPGWSFVTGEAGDVAQLLDAFGLRARSRDDHTPLVFVTNEPTGKWTRTLGMASAQSIGDAIAEAAGLQAAPAAASDESRHGSRPPAPHDSHPSHGATHANHS